MRQATMVLSATIFCQGIKECVVIIGLTKLFQVFKIHCGVAQVSTRFCSQCAHETKNAVDILAHVIMSVNDGCVLGSLGHWAV